MPLNEKVSNITQKMARAFDVYAPAWKNIPLEHSRIHSGDAYAAYHSFENIPAGASRWITTDIGEYPLHLKQRSISITEGSVLVEVFEDVTSMDTGVLISTYALNRVNVKEHNTQIRHGETPGIVGATSLMPYTVRSVSGGPARPPIVDETDWEWVYKPGIKYGLRLTNNSGGAISLLELNWYWYLQR